MQYEFKIDLKQDEFDGFVKIMNIVTYYKAITGLK